MAVTTPDWLARRRGELREGVGGDSWLVVFDGAPQYRLVPRPAGGRFTCELAQTINGRRLDHGAIYPSLEEAVRGGLEELRKALGW